MLSGSGNGTGPGNVVWFCHLCMNSFVLPLGQHHVCTPAPGPKEASDA